MNAYAVTIAALIGAFVFSWQAQDWRRDREIVQLEASHAQAIAKAAEAILEAQHDLAQAQDQHAREAAEKQAVLARTRSAADDAGQRLRIATAAHAATACTGAAVGGVGEAATPAVDLLTDLLGELDAREGALAAEADARHAAGIACERRYEEVRERLSR